MSPYLNLDPYQGWMLSEQKYGSVKSSPPVLLQCRCRCHNNQSSRRVLDHTVQGIGCSAMIWVLLILCELILRQTNSFPCLRGAQRMSLVRIIQWVKVCTIKSGPAWTWALGCYLGRNIGQWLGRRHSGYMIQPHTQLQFVHKFTKTKKNKNLPIFPRQKKGIQKKAEVSLPLNPASQTTAKFAISKKV